MAVPLLALTVLACGRDGYTPGGAPVTFDTARVRVETARDTIPLTVEVAEDETQRAYGLMERDSLPPGSGMLFLYDLPQGPGDGFWMWRTRIPLDIAFFDEDGRIVAVRTMEPCPSAEPRYCPSYAPGAAYSGALEVPAGWFERHGVGVDDRVVREPPVADDSPRLDEPGAGRAGAPRE